jgi:phosphate acyltransferase
VKKLIILVDAMGGDNAPDAIINGCIDAILEKDGFEILLIGDSEKINEVLKHRNFKNSRLCIKHTTQVVTGEDSPAKAIKSKKDSSMVVGFNMLKEKQGDVFVSAGNSGALMAGALFILGRIKGIDRPALPALIPTNEGNCLLIDAGLNTVCKPINYLQFGVMGSIYMKELFEIKNPKVGLMNVGSESGKGREDIKQAFSLISESNLNFIGNIEGKDLTKGNVDVAVADGYVGNVALKSIEGIAEFLLMNLKGIFKTNLLTKLAFLAIKKPFMNFYKKVDPDVVGGAPVLGVNGLVIKSHGSSKAKTIKNVIINRAYALARTSVLEQISEEFKNMEVEDIEQ